MDRERDVAAGTLPDLAAVGAMQEGGVAAPIEQQERLLAAGQSLHDRRGPALRTRGPLRCPSTFGATRRSTSSTGGSGRAPTRSGRRSRRSLTPASHHRSPATASRSRGPVARPRSAHARRPRPACGSAGLRCSCSWPRAPRPPRSMPRSATGANTAERAPTATRRSPRRSSRQASARSPSDSPL